MNLELENALAVLAEVHTRGGDETCDFAIMRGGPAPTDELAYVNAWRTVRKFLRHAGRIK